MKIAICGSMSFAKEMVEVKDRLEKLGKEIVLPKEIEKHIRGEIEEQSKWEKIEFNVFKDYFNEIKNCDAILVINESKNDIPNYIGGNSLIEMAFAHVLDKKIFLLNPIPFLSYTDEIEAMSPIILNGDLNQIKENN